MNILFKVKDNIECIVVLAINFSGDNN